MLFRSGALSMFSKSTAALPATLAARVFVIAAVKVVLPWSTCPIVPMLAEAAGTNLDEFFHVVRNTATGAAERETRTNNGWEADLSLDL